MKTNLRKRYLLLPVMMILVLTIFTACGAYGTTPQTTSTSSSGNSVTLANYAFSPATLTVTVGTTVTWTNKDSVIHTVTSDSGAFNSGNMALNATYSYTFNTAGTFTYICSIHPTMKGTIVVK